MSFKFRNTTQLRGAKYPISYDVFRYGSKLYDAEYFFLTLVLKHYLKGVILILKIMEKIRIVVADDHAVVREGTRRLLEKEPDMELLGEAANGAEAVKLVNECRPDVVILDISMPDMSGIEVTRQIKVDLPTVIVLILSAYDDDEYVFALLEAGAAGYLLKDAPGRELVEAVRSVYAGEPVLHPSIARKVIQRAVNRAAGDDVADEKARSDVLTNREREVLHLAAQGKTNKEIADTLCISIRTVQRHLNILFNKLNVGSRTEAIFKAVKTGWLSFEDLA